MRGVRTDVRFLYAFGLDVPTTQVIAQDGEEALLWIANILCTETDIKDVATDTHNPILTQKLSQDGT